jgi:hypothetical protein
MLHRSDYLPAQEELEEFLYANPYSAAFADAGIGKTAVFLHLIKKRLEEQLIDRALVVAPIRVATQTWPNEIPEWSSLKGLQFQLIRAEDDDPLVRAEHNRAYRAARQGLLTAEEAHLYHVGVTAFLEKRTTEVLTAENDGIPTPPSFDMLMDILDAANHLAFNGARFDGLSPDEAKRAAGFVTTRFKEHIRQQQALVDVPLHIINREHIGWLVEFRRKRGRGWGYPMVVYDESDDLSDHRTNRFRALRAIRPFCKFFHEATATPNAEGWEKLFAQVALLDGGERLGKRLGPFRERHFTYSAKRYKYTLKKGHDQIISGRIADICKVMKAEDYLPKEATHWSPLPRRIVLPDDVRAMYDEFLKTNLLQLPEDEDEVRKIISADNAASLRSKLLQFASGAVYDDETNWHLVHDEKIEELRQLIHELQGEPLLVSYWWRSSQTRLRKSFPGIVFMDRKGSQVPDWNKGKIPLLALHPQGSAHGLNMQKGPGHDLAIFDMFASYRFWYQLHKRLARQGQTRPVRSWPILVKDSADEIAYRQLSQKKDGQDALFHYIMKLRKELKESSK